MQPQDLMGAAGGVITTASFVPQVIRTWRRRSADDLSWGWLVAFFTGAVLWGANGVLTGNTPLVASNGVMGGLVLTLALLKAAWTRAKAPGRTDPTV